MPSSHSVRVSHVASVEIAANVLSVSVQAGQRVSATDAVATTGEVVHDGDPLVIIPGA